ncbi:nucleotide exchange factor GrpE [Patescibacteria group bacterium]|nr:nucleotide exchange factor GrpE [Patescibacteria group bacterium]
MDDDRQDKQNQTNNTADQADQIEKLTARITELENNWKRALADYKNLERRTAEEKREFAEFANLILLQRLLPILDNLQLLAKHVDDTGLKMIIKEFDQLLADSGVTELESTEKVYDCETMECVETVKCGEENHDTVVETVTPGYKFKNKLLRPAKVRVGKAQS